MSQQKVENAKKSSEAATGKLNWTLSKPSTGKKKGYKVLKPPKGAGKRRRRSSEAQGILTAMTRRRLRRRSFCGGGDLLIYQRLSAVKVRVKSAFTPIVEMSLRQPSPTRTAQLNGRGYAHFHL